MKKSILSLISLAVFVLLVLFHEGCAPFVDSPFSDQVLTSVRSFNDSAILRIRNIEADGKITIAMIADVHQNYVDLDRVIYQINQTPNIDFVANLGDFTNSGYNLEYDQFMDSYINFHQPVVTTIGNHDAIGSGPELFKKVFGPINFYFETSSHRFIFFNSANLESPESFFPQWLKDAVDSSAKPVIIFTHCSLQDTERFFGSTASLFDSVIQDPKVRLILNGHKHVYDSWAVGTTRLVQMPRVQGGAWVLLEIQGNQLTITQEINGTQEVVTLK